MKLKLSRKTETVDMEVSEGDVRQYTLTEMSGSERDEWLTSEKNRTTWKDGKPSGISDFKDIQAKLVAYCLKDDKGADVPLAVIRDWPASVQKALYERCQDINGLTVESEEEKKP